MLPFIYRFRSPKCESEATFIFQLDGKRIFNIMEHFFQLAGYYVVNYINGLVLS